MSEKYMVMVLGDSKTLKEQRQIMEGWKKACETYEPVVLTESEKSFFKKDGLVKDINEICNKK
jgi:hypothetical protein